MIGFLVLVMPQRKRRENRPELLQMQGEELGQGAERAKRRRPVQERKERQRMEFSGKKKGAR